MRGFGDPAPQVSSWDIHIVDDMDNKAALTKDERLSIKPPAANLARDNTDTR
jgi:hypothetical protein